MASKATSERQRGLHKALLIAASLAMVLAAAPVLAQEEEGVAPTRAIAEPEATPPAATTDSAPGAGYQDGGIGGVLVPLEVIPADPASGQQPDPGSGQPPSVTPDNPDAAQEGQSPAQQAALAAGQAAQEARLAASDAEEAAQSTLQQSSASPEDIQVAQQAAQEARLAASDAEEAAEVAQQAAAQEDVLAAQEAAREAQQATQEAQQASGAVQQVAQQIVDAVGGAAGADDVKDAYTTALQATPSAGAGGGNVAFAAESDAEKGVRADPEKASSSGGETEEAASGKGVRRGATGEAEPEEDASESGSDTAVIATSPAQQEGGFPLLLGGGAILAAGVFVVARKLIWS